MMPASIIIGALLAITACSTTEPITSNSDGSYSVTASSYTSERAYKAALAAAQDYCGKQGKHFVTKDGKPSNVISNNVKADDRDPASATTFEKDRHPFTSKGGDSPKATIDFKCV